jgi:primosomal protein N'
MDDEIKKLVGKKVFLKLKGNRNYTGIVISVNDSKMPLTWISIIDKFGKRVIFCDSEIEVIEEVQNVN